MTACAWRCAGEMQTFHCCSRSLIMFPHRFQRFANTGPPPRPGAPRGRLSCTEDLEPRLLLAGSPTIYTVDVLSDTGTGSGTTGDLLYAVRQADANTTNPDGSVIQFAPLLFNVPRTLTLTQPLELSQNAGPVAIVGPGAPWLTISGGGSVQDFEVSQAAAVTISGLTISGGEATFSPNAEAGGGLENDGGT